MATADVSYVPGALTAVAGDQCWALVEVSPDSPAVTRIWQQLGQGAAADALLAGLLADGIGGTPGFTLLVAGPGGQHRLFCRGMVGATVVTAPVDGAAPRGSTRAVEGQAATERIDGAGLLTWREQVVDNAERIFLGEPPADSALRLPATSGVLLAGCVIIELTKTIVFFPDTITMTHPGSLLGQASAASAALGQPLPDDRGRVVSPAPSMPFAAAPVGPAGPSGGPGRPDVPGSGAFPAPAAPATGMPTAAGPAVPFSGPVPAGVPSGPGAAGGPGPTVKRAEVSEIAARTTPPDRIGPVVPALICPSGHVNPPSGAACRRCGAPLPHDPVPVPRPVLGVLRLSLGGVITLDRGVLMGRNPRTVFGGPGGFGGSGGEERPHVVKLPSADGDISRTHLRVTLDGWHVLVTDLNSTNGTLVTLPGRDPQQLRPGEPVPIQPGTVVTLADGIDFRYEVTN